MDVSAMQSPWQKQKQRQRQRQKPTRLSGFPVYFPLEIRLDYLGTPYLGFVRGQISHLRKMNGRARALSARLCRRAWSGFS
jgi:hypothetical protein